MLTMHSLFTRLTHRQETHQRYMLRYLVVLKQDIFSTSIGDIDLGRFFCDRLLRDLVKPWLELILDGL